MDEIQPAGVEPPSRGAAWIRRHPRLSGILAGLFVTVVLAGIIEGVFWVLVSARPVVAVEFDPLHREVGGRVNARLVVEGNEIFDVTYTLDQYGRRYTPSAPREETDDAVFFFGGSFTFGAGVEDDETLPSAFANHAAGWHVVNFGMEGHGAANMVQRVRHAGTFDPYRDMDAICVYVFIPGHVSRSIGSMRIVTGWGREFPHYRFDEAGRLRYLGTFEESRPWRTWLYDILADEPFMRYFRVDLPPRHTSNHLEFTVQLIDESRTRFGNLYDRRRFYVVLYPTRTSHPDAARRLLPFLERYDIPYFDYAEMLDGGAPRYFIPHDGHPTPEAHGIIAKRLAEDLGFLDDEP